MPDISERKADHLRLAAAAPALSGPGPGFADVALVHCALPELDLAEIDPSVELLGRRFPLPLWIASMTGGHAGGGVVNATLARVAERRGLAMGIGSQRAALRDPALRNTFAVARREAPTAFLLANIGAPQLVAQGRVPPLTLAEVEDLVGMIGADALVIHLNAIQELAQPEGDRNGRGWEEAIAGLAAALPIPVVAKETGGGLSEDVARRLASTGVSALDVGGRGGTNFADIERRRAAEQGKDRGAGLGRILAEWGIPTAVTVVLAARAGIPTIATGGVRSGIDAARAVALGASAVGVARPLLEAVLDGGDEAVESWIDVFRDELLAAMFLTGSRTVSDLRSVPCVVSGETRQWLDALGGRARDDRAPGRPPKPRSQ